MQTWIEGIANGGVWAISDSRLFGRNPLKLIVGGEHGTLSLARHGFHEYGIPRDTLLPNAFWREGLAVPSRVTKELEQSLRARGGLFLNHEVSAIERHLRKVIRPLAPSFSGRIRLRT